MSRMFVRGDTHGSFGFLPEFCEEEATTKEDVLVILGDAGINYYGEKDRKEEAIKKYIASFPITLLCVRGNHEARPEDRKRMRVENRTACGGDFEGECYYEELYPNILYAKDGGVYRYKGDRILTIGGAYSVDKYYRLMMHLYWNMREQLDKSEMKEIQERISRDGGRFKYVFTHTCPWKWRPTDLFLSTVDQNTVDESMEKWLDEISGMIKYDHWYFGHFHDDRKDVTGDGKVTMLYNKYIKL